MPFTTGTRPDRPESAREPRSRAAGRAGVPLAAGLAAALFAAAVGAAPRSGPSPRRPAPDTGSTHWAFQPLRKPPLPAVKNAAWCRTPIDWFILARLEAKGLHPSPPADPRTLIRRVTYDLTGLPPTPEEVEAFVRESESELTHHGDTETRRHGEGTGGMGVWEYGGMGVWGYGGPNHSHTRPAAARGSGHSHTPIPPYSHTPGSAYERLVDRLLASPRYGERWGRHWLDVVHYGDTHGYDKDKRRDHAWPYRDYVIRAFNEDRPYGRFIEEQVAGDVLYPDEPEASAATGFVAAGPWDFVGQVELREGTVEKEKTRVLDRDDMVANAMSTFTSLTVHCARCHDHKFDPISQKEYYGLQAVFAGVDRGDRPRFDRKRAALEGRQKALSDRRGELLRRVAAVRSPELDRLDGELKAARAELAPLLHPPTQGPSPSNGYHSAIEARADVPKWVQVDLGRSVPIDAIWLVPARPTDFADTPGFGFPARFRILLSDDPTFARAEVLADRTAADYPNPGDSEIGFPAGGHAARYVRVLATRLWPRTNDFVFALAELEVESGGKNVAAGAAVSALDSIEQGRWSRRYLVDGWDSRVRRPDRSNPRTAALLARRDTLVASISEKQQSRRALAESLLAPAERAELERTSRDLEAVEAELRALAPPEQVYTVLSHPPRPIHVLARGDVEQPREAAVPGALSCVPGQDPVFHLADPEDEGSRRAALAHWLSSPKNPLTWRSIVNRVWHYHFGRGLVDTPNDFGANGSSPTHPELLDWLASDFVAAVRVQAPRGYPGFSSERPTPSAQSRTRGAFPEPRTLSPDRWNCGGSLKRLHRLILLSSVYRQASREDPAAARVDTDNRLLWRMNRQRLDAESIRDSVLTVSGKLDLTMGGPGFELFRFKDDHSPVYDHSAPEKINDPAGWRRAVYRFTVRSVPNPFMESLDCADPSINTPVRNTTLTALQALALLNDPFIVRQSGYFAERLRGRSAEPEREVELAYALALGRPPRPDERAALAAYARKHGLANACRLLFNTSEFVFID